MIPPSKVHPRFWVPVWSDPQLAAEAEDLALKIAGDGVYADIMALAGDGAAPAQILALARDVAAAQIERRRVQEVEHELSRGLDDSRSFIDLVAAARLTRVKSAARLMILAVYDRERRAFSRYEKANRAFQAALRRQQRGAFRLAAQLQRRIDKRTKKANAA